MTILRMIILTLAFNLEMETEMADDASKGK